MRLQRLVLQAGVVQQVKEVGQVGLLGEFFMEPKDIVIGKPRLRFSAADSEIKIGEKIRK